MWPRLRSARSPVSRSSAATVFALNAHALGDRADARRAAAKTSVAIRLQPVEEVRVADQADLRHLGVAGAELALRQRVERVGVGEDQGGLQESADEVLAMPRVDAGLAADAGIDLRQQGGRHLHEAHAAPCDRRGEAGEVADDAAAERHHHVAALAAATPACLHDHLQPLEALRAFAGRDDDLGRADAGASSSEARRAGRWCARDVSSVTIATLRPGSSAAIRSPASAIRPGPITTS